MKFCKNLIIILLLTVIACGGEGPEKVTIETIDGVKYVNNHQTVWGDTPGISLEFVRQFGELESANENNQFFKPVDVDVDSKGNIYILEEGNCRIQKFGPDGEYKATFGRKGLGPGEFSEPAFLTIHNDKLYVRELSTDIIKVLDETGREIRRINLKKAVVKSIGDNNNVIIPSDFFITSSNKIISGINNNDFKLAVFDTDGTLLKMYTEKRNYEAADEDEILAMIFPDIMNKMSFFVDKEGFAYAVFHCQNRIEKYSPDAKLLMQVKREQKYPETTKFEKELRETTMVFDGREVKQKEEMPKYNMFCRGAQLDNKGRLWTAGYIRQKDNEKDKKFSDYMQLEVFEPDGRLLGYLPFPEKSAWRFRIINNCIFFIDKSDAMCIYEYRIVK